MRIRGGIKDTHKVMCRNSTDENKRRHKRYTQGDV